MSHAKLCRLLDGASKQRGGRASIIALVETLHLGVQIMSGPNMDASGIVLLLLLLVANIAGCEATGEVIIENRTGGVTTGDASGESFSLGPWDDTAVEIVVGKNWGLNSPQKDVTVTAEGDCLFRGHYSVLLSADDRETVYVLGNAGYIEVCNATSSTMDLYMVACSASGWGSRDGQVYGGSCRTIKVSQGCWDLQGVIGSAQATRHGVWVGACDALRWTISPAAAVTSTVVDDLEQYTAQVSDLYAKDGLATSATEPRIEFVSTRAPIHRQ